MADNIDPNYYQFPNGAEAVDITRYLTSNGGQAVGYIARATRADGLVKGNPIEDLEKARHFINDEIYRLGGDAEPISKLAKEARDKRPSAAGYKAQVTVENLDLPRLAEAITLPVRWLGPIDESAVAPGWLLKDEYDWSQLVDDSHQYLKQLLHPGGGWVYAICNEYGEERGVTTPRSLRQTNIAWPITLVKQKEEK